MVVETISQLDTYIYAMVGLIFWNFVMTYRLSVAVFGDKRDDTDNGLAGEVEEMQDEVDDESC